MLSLAGCGEALRQPPCVRPDLAGCVIDDIEIQGGVVIRSDELEERLATAESSRILGGALERVPLLSVLDTLTVDYERFDRFVLERDLARIERTYRSRGFYAARVRAARVQRTEEGRVRIRIVVTEGEPVKVASVDIQWKDWSLEKAKGVTRPVTDARNRLRIGARFDEERYEATKKAMVRAMSDRGFAYSSVSGHVEVDLVAGEARVTFTIELGPECRFGPIALEGLGELPERPLRAALGIKEGDLFSTEALEDAERTLANHGVFGAIEARPRRSAAGEPPNPVVPVTFVVQPAALRSVQLGGGAELGDRIEAHLVAGWEDRNFLGGLRRFSVAAKPGLVFYPTRLNTLFDEPPSRALPELSLSFELRQPAIFEPRTTAIFRGAFKHYRLRTTEVDTSTLTDDGEEPNILGYREYAGAVGLERPFLKGDLNTALFYNVQLNDPFSYNADIPDGFRRLVIPYFQTIVSYDLRRDRAGKPDRINPRKGIYLSTDAQVAGYLAGDAEDVRIQPEFRAYIPVSRRATLAFRLGAGVLFPNNYGGAFSEQDRCARVRDVNLLTPANEAKERCLADLQSALGRDLQLLQFRAFFSGGASSNRGYAYNEVGPHGSVPSLTGGQVQGIVPTGGLSMWESSLELRIPIAGNFGTALFVDASDVTRQVLSFRLRRPHVSVGAGLRYSTPVGPLRADIGFRVPCAQVVGVCSEADLPEGEGIPGTLLGLPLAVSIAIGEAF